MRYFLIFYISAVVFSNSSCHSKNPRLEEFKHLIHFPTAETYIGVYELDSISLDYLKSLGVSDSVKHWIALTKDSMYIYNLPGVFIDTVELSMVGQGYFDGRCRISWGTLFNQEYLLNQHGCMPAEFRMPVSYTAMLDNQARMSLIYGSLRGVTGSGLIIYRKTK